ncbi:MAG: GNAT family N-acetyltransferase, partial [Mycobacteriales bacterium]
ETIAVARAVVDDGWLGVTAVEVAPPHRRRGLALRMMASLTRWGAGHGAVTSYLQVREGNAAANALYDRLGYTTHHRYHYRAGPPG